MGIADCARLNDEVGQGLNSQGEILVCLVRKQLGAEDYLLFIRVVVEKNRIPYFLKTNFAP